MEQTQMESQNEDKIPCEEPNSVLLCDEQLIYSRPLQNHVSNSTQMSNILGKDVKVHVERLDCILNEDSVNITCDRCSIHFTSLSKLILHFNSTTKTTINKNNKNKQNKSSKESFSLVSHSSCDDGNYEDLSEPINENELQQQNVDAQVPENSSSRRIRNKIRNTENNNPFLVSVDNENVDVESDESFTLQLAPTSTLKKQMRNKSKKELEIPGAIICEFCGMELKSMNRLRKHLVCHSSEFPFVCTEPNCSKAFKRKYSLIQHKVIHTDNFSFLCTECGDRFHTNARLKVHMFSHSDKIYKCDFDSCDFSSAFKQSLKSHVKAKHENETFCCSMCEKVFKHKATLRYHEISHSVKGIVKCTEVGCSYETGHPANLHKHRKQHHNGAQNKRKKGRKKIQEHLQLLLQKQQLEKQKEEEQGNFAGQSSFSTTNNNNYEMNLSVQNVEIIVEQETQEQPQFQLDS